MKVRNVKKPDEFIVWDLSPSKWGMKPESVCKSNIQFKIGQWLKNKYPLDNILEDITIPGTRLSLDFYLPKRKLAIEVQGKQHFKRNDYFHSTNLDFINQQSRDNMKQNFCDLNAIQLITADSEKEIEQAII